jgi:DNA-binding GntR family transcriptional regulator
MSDPTPVKHPRPAPRPIQRPVLHESIVSHLRDMIIEGDLAPGSRLHEGELGAQLGVSRTPLREAIKYLAREGLVELVPSRGAIVKTFGAKEIKDMLSVLETLEEMAGHLACQNATDAQIGEIRTVHDEMIRRYRRRDRLQYYKLNQQFHTMVVGLSDNATLIDTHTTLQLRLKRVRFLGHEGADKWTAAVSEHEEMIAALEARDGDRLARILRLHLSNAWTRVRSTV